jgi:cell division protein FtsN
MKRKKRSKKKSDGVGYKFLVVSLLIIMFVIFLIGLQIGRVVEKTSRETRGNRVVTKTFDEEDVGKKIEGDIEKMREIQKPNSQERRVIVPSETMDLPQKKGDKKDVPAAIAEKQAPASRVEKKEEKSRRQSRLREMLYLQVGVFSVAKNAENMKNRLEKYGMGVKVETNSPKKGTLLRKVLVGPFSSSEELEREREKILRLTGTKPILVKRQE